MSVDPESTKRAGKRPSPNLPPLGGGTTSATTVELERWEGESVAHWARAWGLPELHIVARTTSTNEDARKLADLGAPGGTTVIANEQTAGKGRRGRSWLAPPGTALLLSTVLRPPRPRTTLRAPTAVPIHVGLAVARAIEAVAPVVTGLKWPNDVLVTGSGKIAGVLCEGALGASATEYVIAGIGINVNQRTAELPDGTDARATSLAIAAGREIPRAELAGALAAELGRVIRAAGEPLDDALLDEYARRDVLRGEPVIVDETIRGIPNGITREGGLRLEREGRTQTLLSGTVRLANGLAPRYPTG